MKAKVLGIEYEIIDIEETNDNLEKYPLLKDSNGYTDITTKQIYMLKFKNTEETFKKLDVLYRKTLRHELVHAFLFESGLFNNSSGDWARNEEVIDWIAIQFEKMLSTFIQTKAIIGFDNPVNNPINLPKVKEAKASVKIPELAIPTTDEIIRKINESIANIKVGGSG